MSVFEYYACSDVVAANNCTLIHKSAILFMDGVRESERKKGERERKGHLETQRTVRKPMFLSNFDRPQLLRSTLTGSGQGSRSEHSYQLSNRLSTAHFPGLRNDLGHEQKQRAHLLAFGSANKQTRADTHDKSHKTNLEN